MKKPQIAALVLAAVFCCAQLASCNSGDSNGSGDSSDPVGSGDSVDSGGSGGSVDSVGSGGSIGSGGSGGSGSSTIKVGILAPLSGSVAQYGINVRNGAKLYFDQINAAGGIVGKMVEVIEYDGEGDPAKAVTGYNSLLDKGVTAIIGDVTTTPTLAVVPEAFKDNIPMITASATAVAVTFNEETGQQYSNMFRSCFIDPFQGQKMAAFSVDVVDATKAAVLYNIGSDYSTGVKDAYVASAGNFGLEIVASEGYADGAVDFQSQLANIASKSPDVLFVPDYYETIALVAQQARGAGLSATMLGVDGWDAVLTVVTDPSLLEGAYYCSGYSSEDTNPAVSQFLEDYKTAYDAEPNMFSAQGYDAAMILADALKMAEDQKLGTGSDEYRSAVIAAMKATNIDCVTGHITYDAQNNPEKDAVIIKLTGGEAKFWGKF